jgi:menaquinone-specific isochorismate synthase
MRTVVRTVAIGTPPPVLDHSPPLVWLSPDQTLVGFGEAIRIAPGIGGERFDVAQSAFSEWVAGVDTDDQVSLPGSGPMAFASFTFDHRSHGSVVVVPEVVVGCHRGQWFLTTVDHADATPIFHPSGTAELPVDRPRYAGASIPDVAWLEAVAGAITSIGAGRLDKVVLARDYAVWSKERFDPRRVLRNLEQRFPDCFVFAVDGLLGASPELLARISDRTVESVALAGSARRSADPVEDEQIGKALLSSDKDRREHEMAAASVGRVLGEMCERMLRDPEPVLVELANVRHLATRFRGKLSERRSVLDIAGRLHPTAAVGGHPTDAAIDLIRLLEGMDRGRYAGPVGWMDRHGDGEFAIALRCAEISGARARLFAGAGIVAGSLPENELEETRLKLQAMLTALE